MNKNIERPLGTTEKVFWVLVQKTTTHFAVVGEIDGNATDQEWCEALDLVQKRHPNLSVQISGNEYSTVHFRQVAYCPIPLRIIYSEADEDWNTVLEEELKIPIDTTIAPLARAVLIQQPGNSVFIFLSNHSIGDGMSITLLIRDILTVLSGNTIENLMPMPSLDEIAGVAVDGIEMIELPDVEQAKNKLTPRKTVHIDRLKFSSELSEKLIQKSKNEQTTVHGALSAAIVLAIERLETSTDTEPVRILHPLSARKTLKIGDDFGLFISFVPLPYDSSAHPTFWDFARHVRKDIATMQNAEWIKSGIEGTRGLFYNGMDVEAIEQALYQGTVHEIMLTNLGQLSFSSDFGPLQLKSIWGPMALTLHQAARTIGVATFNGALTLTLTGSTSTQSLLKTVEEIIEESCQFS
jgi:hypothetical protein